MRDQRPTTTRTTTDHDEIREWVEARDAKPACVTESVEGDDRRILDIDVPGTEHDENLENVPWDAFFERFERENLAFEYAGGVENDAATRAPGDFYRFVHRGETGVAEVPDEDVTVVAVGATPVPTRPEMESASEMDLASPSESGAQSDPMTESESEPTADSPPESPATSRVTVGLVVDEIHEDATGYDHWNENDEYLVFRNDGDEPLALAGWTVENFDGETYEFPEGFVLEPNRTVTLRSGPGEDTDSDLYWGSKRAVWKNTGDVLTVRDGEGKLVLRESY